MIASNDRVPATVKPTNQRQPRNSQFELRAEAVFVLESWVNLRYYWFGFWIAGNYRNGNSFNNLIGLSSQTITNVEVLGVNVSGDVYFRQRRIQLETIKVFDEQRSCC